MWPRGLNAGRRKPHLWYTCDVGISGGGGCLGKEGQSGRNIERKRGGKGYRSRTGRAAAGLEVRPPQQLLTAAGWKRAGV